MPRVSKWSAALTLVLLFSGCMTPPPGGNNNANTGNSNANSNANANANSNANTNANTGGGVILDDVQKSAINAVANGVENALAVLGCYSGLVNPAVDLSNPPVISSIAGCPTVFLLRSNDSAVVSLDFGAGGCSNAKTANTVVNGIISLSPYTVSTRTGTVTFENFKINDVAVTGGGSLTAGGNATDGVTLQGNVNFTVGTLMVSGAITITLRSSGEITINATDLSLTDGGSMATVDLTNVVANPVANGNFVPQSGTAAFALDSNTIEVTFTSASPQTGVVQVRVDGIGPANHSLLQ